MTKSKTSLLFAVALTVAWFQVDTRLRVAAKVRELQRTVEVDLAGGAPESCDVDLVQGRGRRTFFSSNNQV